ncbi:MAG: hypothetical protein UDO63_02470 [Oscillospiraceae bacterium]
MKNFLKTTICILIIASLSTSCGNSNQATVETTTLETTSIEETTLLTTEETSATESSTVETSTVTEPTTSITANKDGITPYNIIEKYKPEDIPDFLKSIDWNESMVVNSPEELEKYIDEQCSQFKTVIPFIMSGSCDTLTEENNHSLVSNEKGIPKASLHQQNLSHDDVKAIYCVYNVVYYPSAYVVYAYQTGDKSYLEGDNNTLYEKAVDFIENTLDKDASDIEKERQIHDYICDITTYFTDESQDYTDSSIPRFRSAIGSMIDGQANCMGYTDTFYMLCTMAGLKVEKVNSLEEMKHTWNVITLDDKKYVVDVTWDDDALEHNGEHINNYVYFNASLDIISEKYRYDASVETPMQEVVSTCDDKYFFAMNNSNYGYLTNNREEFYSKVKELIESGQDKIYIACKNNVAGDTNDMAQQIFNQLDMQVSLNGVLQNLSGYSFAYIESSVQ